MMAYPALENNASNTYMAKHHEHKNKDEKSLFLIPQCAYSNIFEKIVEEDTTKGS